MHGKKIVIIVMFILSFMISALYCNISIIGVQAGGSAVICNLQEGCRGSAKCEGGEPFANCDIQCFESKIVCPTQ